jgi:hypothetical protein
MSMSAAITNWSWMLFSGVNWYLRSPPGRKVAPRSVMLPLLGFCRMSEYTWKPPESVKMGPRQSGHAVQTTQRLDGRRARPLHQVIDVHLHGAHAGRLEIVGRDCAHHALRAVGQESRQRQGRRGAVAAS